MQLSGNTVFITGAASGIGRGLAEAFHRAGSRVIVSARREDRLREICEANPGMRYYVLDVTDAAAVLSVAARAVEDAPALDCVINNAGIQRRHDFASGGPLDDAALAGEVNTNLLGLVRVTAAFLPHLKSRPRAALVNVSSGLGFVPRAVFPVYCATKAAVHSFTMSLRQQLRGSAVKVVEVIPPYVATELGGAGKHPPGGGGKPPMPLDVFIAEAMRELATDADELAIGDAKKLVAATCPDSTRQAFAGMNR